jgi:methionyl aminopeptidase
VSELITGQKTAQQLDAMREGGKILARIFDDIRGFVHAGQTEQEIDAFVASKIAEYGATATYKTSEVNFPGNICISVNEQIVHSIPRDYVILMSLGMI